MHSHKVTTHTIYNRLEHSYSIIVCYSEVQYQSTNTGYKHGRQYRCPAVLYDFMSVRVLVADVHPQGQQAQEEHDDGRGDPMLFANGLKKHVSHP